MFGSFGKSVYDGETFTCEVDGFTVTATIYQDDDLTPPWDREDGHGPVSDWTTRAKRSGERELVSDRSSKRFYDFEEAMRMAKRDGWDAEPIGTGTRGERALRAVEADFKSLQDWCNDHWTYVGVAVTVSLDDIELTGKYDHALWGIESDCGDYIREVANESIPEALAAARVRKAQIADKFTS